MTASRLSGWNSLLLSGLLAASPAWANDLAGPRYHVQGFAAQGLIGSTNNNFFGESRDGISTEFTEAGLHGSWQPLDALRLAGQVLYRRAGESDQDGLRLDYAQADWQFHQTDVTQIGLKLGKVKLPYGLYNETRDVPFTRPGILLPQSVYIDNSRDLLLAAPGVFLHGASVQAYGATDFQLGWVRPDFDSESVEYVFLGTARPGKLKGKGAIGARLRWDTPADTTLMLTYADAKADYEPAGLDSLAAGKVRFRNLLATVQQRLDTLTLTAEYGEPRGDLTGFGPALPDNVRNVQAFYLQGEWRFRPAWELMLRHEHFYRDKHDRNGSQFEAATGLPAHTMFARDWALGLRWDATPSLMLRAEYHHVDGTGWLPGPDNPAFLSREQRWNMWLLQAAYRF
jgi:TonB dependent receptor